MNRAIKPTGDRKTRFWPGQLNTFGLLPGPDKDGTCPFATRGEGGCSHIPNGRKNPTCYVFNTMSCFKGVRPLLAHNTELLRSLSQGDQVNVLKQEFKRFLDAEMRRDTPKLEYRLHWSGDVFDLQYAAALVTAMNDFPQLHFWCYTRSLPYVAGMANNTPNLNLYISLDRINLYYGLRTYFDWQATQKHDNVQICYMSKTDDFATEYDKVYWQHQLVTALAPFVSMGSDKHAPWPTKVPKLRTCPVDSKKLTLEEGCAHCMGCVRQHPHAVWFET